MTKIKSYIILFQNRKNQIFLPIDFIIIRLNFIIIMISLRDIRKKKHRMKLRELAQKADLSEAYLSIIEAGKYVPPEWTIARIAESLGENFDFISLVIQQQAIEFEASRTPE